MKKKKEETNKVNENKEPETEKELNEEGAQEIKVENLDKEKQVAEKDITTEFEEVLKKVEELEKENSEIKDMLLRKAAEFENYKRRTENEQKNFLTFANESLILNILPVYNDLERSLSHIDDEKSFELTKQGLKLVFDKFSKILESQGVKKIEAKGEPFDFNLHEALMQKRAEDVPPHTVLEVIEPGYMLKDRVIRHAKVIVSQDLQEQHSEEKTDVEESEGEEKEGTKDNE
jgi:molecular chaperone GrpE